MAKLGTFVAAQILTAAELNAGVAAGTTWTPTYANITVGNGTAIAKYGFVGRLVVCRWQLTLGSTSAVTAGATVGLPVTAADSVALTNGVCTFFDTSATATYIGFTSSSALAVAFNAIDASGTYAKLAAISSTVPFGAAFATGDVIGFTLVYEATS